MFDSGVGGLSVLRVLQEKLPGEKILYYGDTRNLPYGEKSSEEIALLSRRVAEYLKSQGVKLLLIACNTATAHGIEAVQEVMGDIPVIGIIDSGARAAAQSEGTLALIATSATVESGAYPRALSLLRPELTPYSLATPALAPLVESGQTQTDAALDVIRESLAPLSESPPDNLLLACTHYPGIAPLINEVLPGVRLIDPALAMVEEAKNLLERKNLLREEGDGEVHFYVSGSPEQFAQSGKLFLGEVIRGVQYLPIG